MKAEIIAVGTELLLGQIVNTNAQYLAEQCASIGVDVYFQTVVGDNAERIEAALRIAKERADLIICTGGLGPTQDDLTKDVLAQHLGLPLATHEPSLAKIVSNFRARGVEMVESNARQALILAGSEPLPNDTGLAVGVAVSAGGTHYVLLPGPPSEMKPMFETYAKRWIIGKLKSGSAPLYSKHLKFAGIGESTLEHRLIDLIEGQTDPTIAPYAKEGEVTIRLTTRASSEAEAMAKLAPVQREIERRVGNHLYAEEDEPIERTIVRTMSELGLTLALAESCTGGLVGELITAVPGSSRLFLGGVVCYSNTLKNRLLQVPTGLLEGPESPGAVSAETAAEMAENVRRIAGADFALSVTGVAGPDPSEGKPVGLVYVGVARKGAPPSVDKLQLSGSRETIRLKAAKHALFRLWQQLKRPVEHG